MNSKDLFDKAVNLLGYKDLFSTGDDKVLLGRMNDIINSVYADLFNRLEKNGKIYGEYSPITKSDEDIELDDNVLLDCFVYGVAALIALGEHDGDNYRFFSRLYEYKRNDYTESTTYSEISDVLP